MLVGYTSFLPEAGLTLYDNLEFLIRIVLAAALGLFIGLERSKRQKEAGTRTHCIIAAAAAVFMILSKYAFLDLGTANIAYEAGVKPTTDASRIASQIVPGISFLGAGVIFKQGKFTIRGLTTAAGIWATAAVGMCIGAGLYRVGIAMTIVLSVVQAVMHRHPIGNDAVVYQDLALTLPDRAASHDLLQELVRSHGGEIVQSTMRRNNDKLQVEMTVRMEKLITYESAMEFMKEHPELEKISV